MSRPDEAALSIAHALLSLLGGTSADAAHVCAAARTYRKQRRSEGSGVPPVLDELEKAFARLYVSAPRFTEAQGSALPAEVAASANDDRVIDGDTLLTVDQAAARMGCHRSTVKRRTNSGDLTAVRHGRVVRYRTADIDTYLKENNPC